GAIKSLGGLSPEFELDADAGEGERRRRLAKWITDVHNPLTPRVIANRIWHYHFGTGLVDTPNDFGFNGGRPPPPAPFHLPTPHELRSRLAVVLTKHNHSKNSQSPNPNRKIQKWALSPAPRLIVTPATYRQSSATIPAAAKVDAGNRFLWRKTPQRLEAEALR